MVARHRHRVDNRDILRGCFGHEAGAQRVSRKGSLHAGQQASRPDDVAHGRGRQRTTEVPTLEYETEEGAIAFSLQGIVAGGQHDEPLAALGGGKPAELKDTPDGEELVSDLVARMQSGAYA